MASSPRPHVVTLYPSTCSTLAQPSRGVRHGRGVGKSGLVHPGRNRNLGLGRNRNRRTTRRVEQFEIVKLRLHREGVGVWDGCNSDAALVRRLTNSHIGNFCQGLTE